MQYDVLHDAQLGYLVRKVNQYAQNGWEPLGGITIIADPESPTGKVFHQAIIKR
jgi:hypothetical protein